MKVNGKTYQRDFEPSSSFLSVREFARFCPRNLPLGAPRLAGCFLSEIPSAGNSPGNGKRESISRITSG